MWLLFYGLRVNQSLPICQRASTKAAAGTIKVLLKRSIGRIKHTRITYIYRATEKQRERVNSSFVRHRGLLQEIEKDDLLGLDSITISRERNLSRGSCYEEFSFKVDGKQDRSSAKSRSRSLKKKKKKYVELKILVELFTLGWSL